MFESSYGLSCAQNKKAIGWFAPPMASQNWKLGTGSLSRAGNGLANGNAALDKDEHLTRKTII
jgi:hypothetical protein